MATKIKHIRSSYLDYLGSRQQNSIILCQTDNLEVIEEIHKLSSRKSSGYIDVPVDLIKHSLNLLYPAILPDHLIAC